MDARWTTSPAARPAGGERPLTVIGPSNTFLTPRAGVKPPTLMDGLRGASPPANAPDDDRTGRRDSWYRDAQHSLMMKVGTCTKPTRSARKRLVVSPVTRHVRQPFKTTYAVHYSLNSNGRNGRKCCFRGLRICISTQLAGDADAAPPRGPPCSEVSDRKALVCHVLDDQKIRL